MVSEEIMEYHKEPFRTEKAFPKQEKRNKRASDPNWNQKRDSCRKETARPFRQSWNGRVFLLLEKENACALNAEDCREVHFVGCLRAIEPSGSGENHEL